MNLDQIKIDIENIVKAFINSKKDLLSRGRVELNFTAELANFLKPYFESYNLQVDAFYNRHFDQTKRLNGGVIELDIAIHQQNSDDNNLLVIELETNNEPRRDDIRKLEEMTRNDGEYKYKAGLFLVVGIEDRAGEIIELSWYENGRIDTIRSRRV